MRRFVAFLLPWMPFAFAVYLCNSTLSHIATSEMKVWEPAFYSFLPMAFFFVGAVVYLMQREIRELRGIIAKLQAAAPSGHVAV
jgi:uncharacterized membrane protein